MVKRLFEYPEIGLPTRAHEGAGSLAPWMSCPEHPCGLRIYELKSVLQKTTQLAVVNYTLCIAE